MNGGGVPMYSDLKECCVAVDATLMDAMRVIDQAGARIALVVDQDYGLVSVWPSPTTARRWLIEAHRNTGKS